MAQLPFESLYRHGFARAAVCIPRVRLGSPVSNADRVIGLARRAGLAVAGFEKVREAVRTKKAGILLLALDGAEGGRRKMRAFGRDIPVAIVLTAAEMGAIFGRDHVVNAAIGDGPLSSRLIGVAEKIAGFRPGALIDRATEPASVGSAQEMVVFDRDDQRE